MTLCNLDLNRSNLHGMAIFSLLSLKLTQREGSARPPEGRYQAGKAGAGMSEQRT